MFFTQKPNAVLFVGRNAISSHPIGNPDSLVLPEEIFKYLEVLDAQKLTEVVTDYANKCNLRGKRVVVVLHKDTIFQKSVELVEGSNPDTITTDYEHTIPFPLEKRHAVGLKQKDRLYLFGANKELYELLVTALQAAGAKVHAVVPGIVYGLTSEGKLTHSRLQQMYEARALTAAVNFLKQ
jgi:hypothetical protein